LAQKIRDNTAKLELLTLLNQEKTELIKILQNQDEKKAFVKNISKISEVYKFDLKKLSDIVCRQCCELQVLVNSHEILVDNVFCSV